MDDLAENDHDKCNHPNADLSFVLFDKVFHAAKVSKADGLFSGYNSNDSANQHIVFCFADLLQL
jgi:hypothetical protein